jgi:vanillate O-demethylase ferredoxin subunit
MRQMSSDVMLFELAPVSGALGFEPGGHLDVHLEVEGRQLLRSYSHVGIGPDRTLQIAVRRMPNSRGGSRAMWGLRPGAEITVSAARNNFPLSYAATCYRLLAGGIGITPMIGMARALQAAGRDFTLTYCVRDATDAAFAEELRSELGDRLELRSDIEHGRLDAAAFVADTPEAAELYMCGPLGMMNAVRDAWAAAGRPPARLRFETFGGAGAAGDTPFAVTVAETGARVEVPASATLLEALVAAGQPVLSDCERGECGLCKVEITESDGAIDHRDVFLSDAEKTCGASMCACVSRLRGGHAHIRINAISHGRTA